LMFHPSFAQIQSARKMAIQISDCTNDINQHLWQRGR
jgi:hypothetical protein